MTQYKGSLGHDNILIRFQLHSKCWTLYEYNFLTLTCLINCQRRFVLLTRMLFLSTASWAIESSFWAFSAPPDMDRSHLFPHSATYRKKLFFKINIYIYFRRICLSVSVLVVTASPEDHWCYDLDFWHYGRSSCKLADFLKFKVKKRGFLKTHSRHCK